MPNGVYVPLFVGYLLELSDPEIRNGHAQAVVDSYAIKDGKLMLKAGPDTVAVFMTGVKTTK